MDQVAYIALPCFILAIACYIAFLTVCSLYGYLSGFIRTYRRLSTSPRSEQPSMWQLVGMALKRWTIKGLMAALERRHPMTQVDIDQMAAGREMGEASRETVTIKDGTTNEFAYFVTYAYLRDSRKMLRNARVVTSQPITDFQNILTIEAELAEANGVAETLIIFWRPFEIAT